MFEMFWSFLLLTEIFGMLVPSPKKINLNLLWQLLHNFHKGIPQLKWLASPKYLTEELSQIYKSEVFAILKKHEYIFLLKITNASTKTGDQHNFKIILYVAWHILFIVNLLSSSPLLCFHTKGDESK